MREFYLASYPRSGNTMTRLLLEHHFDIDTREDYQVVLRKHPAERDYQRPDLENLVASRGGTVGIAQKTHQHDAKALPALVLVRDGRERYCELRSLLHRCQRGAYGVQQTTVQSSQTQRMERLLLLVGRWSPLPRTVRAHHLRKTARAPKGGDCGQVSASCSGEDRGIFRYHKRRPPPELR